MSEGKAGQADPGRDQGNDEAGNAEAIAGAIEIVEYDPQWPQHFVRQADRIRQTLGAKALGVDHVGSTSVPGLAAKPILDIVLTVENSADEPAYFPELESLNFALCVREPNWFEHRMFKGPSPAVNLHVFSAGCPETERVKLFRDWLRSDTADRTLYEQTKRELAARDWRFVQQYADAKSEIVGRIMDRATRWRSAT